MHIDLNKAFKIACGLVLSGLAVALVLVMFFFQPIDPHGDKRRSTRWYYEEWSDNRNSQQYVISMLPGPGHNPLLQFQRRADGTEQWGYDPGDGSPAMLLSFSTRP